ncbi:hypothetical protein [Candidatus Ichthyocystis sparus]|uniref:hypothetical protein n=1 Tax=Candidatus Ichthyocystis sparus TaxID=1561004 RepID=UPI0011469C8B|nr:hypothetical protein [Candidatus Ichthyocystis sparus]
MYYCSSVSVVASFVSTNVNVVFVVSFITYHERLKLALPNLIIIDCALQNIPEVTTHIGSKSALS